MTIDPFAGLEPKALWAHFSAFTRIPRPSGREDAMLDYVRGWAEAHAFSTASDAARNIRVRIPATKGHEAKRPIILQGHLDMVCTRDADAGPYDPEQGRIRVYRANAQGNDITESVNGDWLKAEGTSLGADNGVGVATMLALAVDPAVVHGPLDILLTVEEEAGLVGASQLDPSIVVGQVLLNLDSEDEGVFTIGSAGGRNTEFLWARAMAPAPSDGVALIVTIRGLLGGHSGVDINRGRLNAIRGLARALRQGADRVSLRLASIDGGDRSNAIPREARATVILATTDENAFRDSLREVGAQLAAQYPSELGVELLVAIAPGRPAKAFTPNQTLTFVHLLLGLPTGAIAMSQELPGLVETSNNLAVMKTAEWGVELTCSSRSSVAAALEDVTATLVAAADLAGARADPGSSYPGWNPDPTSPTLATLKSTYERLSGKKAEATAVHAGLECGVLNSRMPGVDMVSFGPTIVGAHSTRERVHIESVSRFYELVCEGLRELAQ